MQFPSTGIQVNSPNTILPDRSYKSTLRTEKSADSFRAISTISSNSRLRHLNRRVEDDRNQPSRRFQSMSYTFLLDICAMGSIDLWWFRNRTRIASWFTIEAVNFISGGMEPSSRDKNFTTDFGFPLYISLFFE